jgi:hypothetical protein
VKYISFLILLLTVLIFSQGVAQSDLSANIMRRVNAANLELDKAEEQIRTGKSEHTPAKLKSVRGEYDNIFNYYKGSFDPNHPTLVKLKNRMDKIGAQLSAGTSGTEASTTTMTVNQSKKTDLSANIRRRIDASDRHLVWVNQGAAKGERAMGELNSAKGEYEKIFEYYKGSFDPEHSDIVALKNRIDAAEQAMNAGFAKKNATAPIESNSGAVEDLPEKMGEDLISIAGALRTLENRLDTADKSSNPGSYVYGVNDDLNIALGKFNRFNTTYKGQFDRNHVAYRQVETRIKKDREAVSALEARAKANK